MKQFFVFLTTTSTAVIFMGGACLTGDLTEGIVHSTLTKTGAYTFLFNGASQQYTYTVLVRNYVDEEAEITKYRSLYGTDCVKVFDPGIHYADYININRDNTGLSSERSRTSGAEYISFTKNMTNQSLFNPAKNKRKL